LNRKAEVRGVEGGGLPKPKGKGKWGGGHVYILQKSRDFHRQGPRTRKGRDVNGINGKKGGKTACNFQTITATITIWKKGHENEWT